MNIFPHSQTWSRLVRTSNLDGGWGRLTFSRQTLGVDSFGCQEGETDIDVLNLDRERRSCETSNICIHICIFPSFKRPRARSAAGSAPSAGPALPMATRSAPLEQKRNLCLCVCVWTSRTGPDGHQPRWDPGTRPHRLNQTKLVTRQRTTRPALPTVVVGEQTQQEGAATTSTRPSCCSLEGWGWGRVDDLHRRQLKNRLLNGCFAAFYCRFKGQSATGGVGGGWLGSSGCSFMELLRSAAPPAEVEQPSRAERDHQAFRDYIHPPDPCWGPSGSQDVCRSEISTGPPASPTQTRRRGESASPGGPEEFRSSSAAAPQQHAPCWPPCLPQKLHPQMEQQTRSFWLSETFQICISVGAG